MFSHCISGKFLTNKRFMREIFSQEALEDGKKSSFSPFLSYFSSLRIMRAICLLPLLAATLPLLAQESASADAAKTAAHAIPAECKNLAKVQDIDDALFQMYSNLDSQCLFDIPAATLEAIWGIPVLDNVDIADEDRGAFNKHYWDLQENAKTLFVGKIRLYGMNMPEVIQLYILPTKAYIPHRKAGIFFDSVVEGRYPPGLPAAQVKKVEPYYIPPREPPIGGERIDPDPPAQSVYEPWSYSYWINKDNDPDMPILVFKFTTDTLPRNAALYSKAKILNELK